MVKFQEEKPFACRYEIRQEFRHVDINILFPARDARKNLFQSQKYIYTVTYESELHKITSVAERFRHIKRRSLSRFIHCVSVLTIRINFRLKTKRLVYLEYYRD